MAALTNDHQLGTLKQHLFYWNLSGQKSEIILTGSKSRCHRAMFPLEALEENPFLAFFNLQWHPAFLGLWLNHSQCSRSASSNLSVFHLGILIKKYSFFRFWKFNMYKKLRMMKENLSYSQFFYSKYNHNECSCDSFTETSCIYSCVRFCVCIYEYTHRLYIHVCVF